MPLRNPDHLKADAFIERQPSRIISAHKREEFLVTFFPGCESGGFEEKPADSLAVPGKAFLGLLPRITIHVQLSQTVDPMHNQAGGTNNTENYQPLGDASDAVASGRIAARISKRAE